MVQLSRKTSTLSKLTIMKRFLYELTSKGTNGGECVYICIEYDERGNVSQEITLNSQENSAKFTLNIDDLNSAKFFDLAQKLLEFEIKHNVSTLGDTGARAGTSR